nr:GtrA family protein [uncultured Sphingomonas sp.]
MIDWRSRSEWRRIFRYYQAGILNSMFGYGLFAALVWAGMNMFLAQVLAHIMGVLFNYFTFSRYAFAGHQTSRVNFVLSYAVNYVVSVATLYLFSHIVASPYLAGLLTIVFVSAVNYLVLKRWVFREPVNGGA